MPLSNKLRGIEEKEKTAVELSKENGKLFLSKLMHTISVSRREVNIEDLLGKNPGRVEKDLLYSAGYNKALSDVLLLIKE